MRRNGANEILRQHVWGTQYIDELVQTGVNQDPMDTNEPGGGRCERFFYACQDANYNVLGVVNATGMLTERYEYTPYGQRTVYSRNWLLMDVNDDGVVDTEDRRHWLTYYCPGGYTNSACRADVNGDGLVDSADRDLIVAAYGSAVADDETVTYPVMESARGKSAAGLLTPTTVGVCDIGHQGLFFDKEFGLYYNRARMYDPEFARFDQWDPTGYADGMNRYQYVRGNAITALDPTGLHIFLRKSEVKEVGGRKTGTTTVYNLLRYEAGDCCKELWGQENVASKLKEVAKSHSNILEKYIDNAHYTYDDGQVLWDIRLKVIITTEKAYALDEYQKASRTLDILKDEYRHEDATYKVNGEFGAYKKVTVVCKPRTEYNWSMVPGIDPKWERIGYEELLAHELVGHHLNNSDEINRGKLLWADDLKKRLGHEIEADSIMTYNEGASKFYNRHFAAGIDDINNISGLHDMRSDNTSEMNIKDPWFSKFTNEKTAKFSFDMVEEIMDNEK